MPASFFLEARAAFARSGQKNLLAIGKQGPSQIVPSRLSRQEGGSSAAEADNRPLPAARLKPCPSPLGQPDRELDLEARVETSNIEDRVETPDIEARVENLMSSRSSSLRDLCAAVPCFMLLR